MASTPSNTSQKPLPAIPHRRNPERLTALTVEASAHLRRFIVHALDQDSHVFRPDEFDSERELWANALESALNDLGDRMDRGGWLAGVCRARRARAYRRAAQQESKEKKETEVKRKDEEGKGTGKSKRGKEKELPGPPTQANAIEQDDRRALAFRHLQDLASKPVLPRPKPFGKHLVLTLVPFGARAVLPLEDMGFDLVPSSVGCVFSPDVFSIDGDSDAGILYGLDEWDVEAYNSDEDKLRLVGGTFCFKGVTSQVQHESLRKVLRLSIYTHLSLLLEQHYLASSHVHLQFPKPSTQTPIIPPVPPRLPVSRQSTPPAPHRRHRHNDSVSASTSGLWSFVSKKTENLLHRAANVRLARRGSLDLPTTYAEGQHLPRTSEDVSGGPRARKLSFFGDGKVSSAPPPPETSSFESAIQQIDSSRDLLSTSPWISISPPALLVSLAEKEKVDSSRRLSGDEKAGLSSILGWKGKDAGEKGARMIGVLGLFVRQQDFSTLYSEHVSMLSPLKLPESQNHSQASASSASSSVSSISTSTLSTTFAPDTLEPRSMQCSERARWMTYLFNNWYEGRGADMRLGEAIEEFASSAEESCERSGCTFKKGEHERRWIHNGVRISSKVNSADSESEREMREDDIIMWESCALCGKKTSRERMSDGTYLLSFARFMELVVYSRAICTLTPPLCDHTTPEPSFDGLPRSRFNIVRHFLHKSLVVSFALSLVEEIYEVKVPRLQIVRSHGEKEDKKVPPENVRKVEMDEEKRALRREIMGWWQDVAEHMDKLEATYVTDDLAMSHKSLPRLPSSDDNYEDTGSANSTPKADTIRLPSHSSSSPNSPMLNPEASTSETQLSVPRPTFHRASTSLGAIRQQHSNDADFIQLLSNLRHSFQRTEQSLYVELSRTPVSSINDVRRSFHSAARGAARRLAAWERKHQVSTVDGELVAENLCAKEPEWWAAGCHAVPSGHVIVREDDWGSIIAFTLSSVDYQQELANLSLARRSVDLPRPPPTTPASSSGSSFFSSGSYTFFKSASDLQPDPDEEGLVWHEPEPHSATISRKEHPRDPTSLLSLPSVLRHKGHVDVPLLSPSRFTSLVSPSKTGSGSEHTPPSAWAKPAVEVSMQAADGHVTGMPEAADIVGKILQDVDNTVESPSRASEDSYDSASSSAFVESHVRRGKAASLASMDSDTTVAPNTISSGEHVLVAPPPLPPKDGQDSRPSSPSRSAIGSSITSTLTSGLANAMRYVLNTSDALPPTPGAKPHHALLNVDSLPIDDRPHIKYDWTIGKRLKFSCTVYYAKQFDALRRRCGIEDGFLKSLERSANWTAEGGKSKSNFWKTKDDRFIIKTLVNAWNVADLQVLIELGPSYFRYIDSTAGKPTVLAKLLGFYTVEIRNLESGSVQAKADLLVMENLFYDQKVSKTFDLKGIQGRKVKPRNNSSGTDSHKTLFDGEWLEGQQRALLLLRPHSKVVLQEAIRSDSDFLSRSNIMDYSLLLGIDEDRKQIACGLVDMIGSYTFAKTLEYKAKQGLSPSGKQVTVIPPDEYQERFVTAMDGYFLACPDKWSLPMDDASAKVPSDVWHLRCPL